MGDRLSPIERGFDDFYGFTRGYAVDSFARNTSLTPRSKIHLPDVAKRLGSMTADGNNPAWDSLDADRRADLARRMKAYAGMDRNIGRLIADLKRSGELDARSGKIIRDWKLDQE